MEDINRAAATCEEKLGEGEGVTREEFSFPSADGVSTIHARWWLPVAAKPRAIVQLIHGMSEHIGRYDQFASFLVSCGFAVCGHDHIGHGRSVSSPEEFGCLPAKQGASIMVADAQRLRQIAAERFPGLKHFVFGHSMGSFVARSLVSKHGQGLAGAIICGTGNQALALSKAGNALANLLCKLRGPRSTSSLIHNMAIGAYAKAIKDAKTPNDWLSHDEKLVESYALDPLCGYMFSVSGYAALTKLTGEVVTPACAAGVPKDLPLLYIAGEQDPVGDCGKGVRAAARLVRSAGVNDVELIMYADMRHEILNEFGKEKVYADVLEWLEGRLS
ncbi:MAG: lysophospholipase [Eggerthellaceae bacterium]|nr:lysophospholipase [Eggerthellaceae bacterium]